MPAPRLRRHINLWGILGADILKWILMNLYWIWVVCLLSLLFPSFRFCSFAGLYIWA